uniref:SFRICE_008691 n=1 Tax=Spodoptera frugiperda TaxID=7108 RepID=A0A2H1WCJ4_SPOFR
MTASQKEKTAFQSQSEPISDASTSLRTQRCSANAGHTATAWAPLRTPGAFPPTTDNIRDVHDPTNVYQL